MFVFLISIHAPAWGATGSARGQCVAPPISIHAPAWGATAAHEGNASHHRFQSTRPRGARLDAMAKGLTAGAISIHAPAWGATQSPAPSRVRATHFNPRARVGRDVEL